MVSLCVSPDFMEKVIYKFPKAITEEDDFGWTPLHYAALFNDKELVKLFLKNLHKSDYDFEE